MKKLAFLFVAVAAMSMASCGGNAQQSECNDECVDSVPCCTHNCAPGECDCDSCAGVQEPIDTLTKVLPAEAPEAE